MLSESKLIEMHSHYWDRGWGYLRPLAPYRRCPVDVGQRVSRWRQEWFNEINKYIRELDKCR